MDRPKHPHKSSAIKHEQLKDVPFVEMSPADFKETWDDIEADSDAKILEEARNADCARMNIAVAVLLRHDLPDRIAYYVAEYGDGEGTQLVEHFVDLCRKKNLLKPGERLRASQYTIELTRRNSDNTTPLSEIES